MKRLILLLSFLIPFSLYSRGSDNAEAKRLIETSQQKLSLKNVQLNFDLQTTGKRGESKFKTLDVSFADFQNQKKVMIEFQAPENVKGTKILSTKYPDKKGIIEIYMPSTGKVQKLRAGRNNLKIMGSEIPITRFSEILDANFNYTLMGKETINGTECHKIKLEGNENDGYGIAFVSVKKEQLLKVERYDKQNRLINLIELEDYMKVDNAGYVYPKQIVVKNLQTGESSSMKILSFKHVDKVKTEDFKLQPKVG